MSRKWVRILAWVAGAVALYTVLGFFAVPQLARSQFGKLLTAELGRPASIERVRFNPFTLEASLEGLTVGGRDRATPGLFSLGRLDTDLAWRSLVKRAPVVERLKLTAPRLHLVREADGRYDIDDLIEKWTATPSEPEAPTPRFALANIELEDGQITFDDRVASRLHEISGLVIHIPFVSSLPVYQEIDVLPKLAATVNGAALEIEGRSRPFAETHDSSLEFEVAPVDLASYAGYLPAGQPVKLASAMASANLRVDFRQPEGQKPMVQIQGSATLEKLAVQDPTGAPLLAIDAIRAEGINLKPFGNAYEIGSVAIVGARATVHRRADEPRFLNAVLTALEKRQPTAKRSAAPAAQAPAAPAPTAPVARSGTPNAGLSGSAAVPVAAAADKLRWAVGEVTLEEGAIDFLDEAFLPRKLAVKASKLRARLADLGSDFTRPVPYALEFVTSTGERVDADGKLRIDPLLVDGKLALDKASLKNWWWIAEPHLQADLLAGMLSAQTAIKVSNSGKGIELALTGLAAELKDLQMAQRWDRKELLRIDSLKVSDTALDLTRRSLEVGSVHAGGGRFSVARDRQGRLNLVRLSEPDGKSVAMTGRKVAAAPAAAAAGEPWAVRLARLELENWSGSLSDAAAGSRSDLTVSGLSLLAEGFSSEPKNHGRLSLKAVVGKSGMLAASGQLGLQPMGGQLRIDARRIGILPAQPYFTEEVNAIVSSGELSAKGDLAFEVPEKGATRASWRGQASLHDFAALAKAGSEPLLRWKTLQLSAIDFVLAPLKVDIGEVALSDFHSRLVISPEGRLNLQDIPVRQARAAQASAKAKAPARAASASPAPDVYGQAGSGQGEDSDGGASARSPGKASAIVPQGAASAPLPIRLGSILLSNGNISFTDNFIRPNYSANLTGLSGRIGTITPDTAGKVEVRGRIDNSGTLEIAGSINPLAPSLFLDLEARASDIDLPRASPYSIKYLGYGIEKGKLSANVKYSLQDRRLQAENRIVLDQLTFGDKVDSPTATKLPVLFALSLLKDRNGVIDVEMPIGGSLDDPQFSVGGLVLRMIFNLITKAVTAPFSVLAGLGGGGAELSQIAFDAGSVGLSASAIERMGKLAKALKDRPGLKMDLSGQVDPAVDRPALRERAMADLVKAQKLHQMARQGDAAPDPDEVTVTPEEFPTYLRLAWRAGDFKKPRNLIGMIKDVPADEMQRMLLASVKLDDDALRKLADDRAQAVKDWLIEKGGVSGERLFVVVPNRSGGGAGKRADSAGVGLSLK